MPLIKNLRLFVIVNFVVHMVCRVVFHEMMMVTFDPLKEKYLVELRLWFFASLQCGAMFKYPSMELFVMGKV
jgi:hypothetical protein